MPTNIAGYYLVLIRHSAILIDRTLPANSWCLSAEGHERRRQFSSQIAPLKPNLFITSHKNKAIETDELLACELHTSSDSFEGLHKHDRQNAPFFENELEYRNAICLMFAYPEKLEFGN